jgi:uncharacterized protein (TIGR00730 family)
MMNKPFFSRITIFCGSADGMHPDYYRAATQMGQILASQGICLVYGAGKTGLMGALADGVIRNGGEVIGIIPESLNTPQLVHSGLTRIEVLPTIQLRQTRMSELAEAFIALPGGFGTFDELFEALTWAQIGLHHKPIGLLNTRDYFNPFLTLINHAQLEGFIFPDHCSLVSQSSDPEELLKILEKYQPPAHLDRWVKRD